MRSEAAALAALSEGARVMAMRALACLAIWHDRGALLWDPDEQGQLARAARDDDDGTTVGDLAAFLGIRPMTPDRRLLETALTELRRARLTHYEFRAGVDSQLRWWLTPQGLAVARKVPVGRSGVERGMPSPAPTGA